MRLYICMQAQNFNQLLDRYLAGTLENGERSLLRRLLDDPVYLEELEGIMDNQLASYRNGDMQELREVVRRIKKSIEEKIAVSEVAIPMACRIHFIKTSWFRYAAAIIVMLGIGAYLWFNNTASNPINPINPTNPNSDIAPVRDRAILTLANGRQIILDSTQGNIIQQGGLTVINVAGKLKYEGIGAAADYNTISTPKGGQYQVLLPDGSRVWLNAASSIKFPTAFTGTVRKVEMTGEVYIEVANDPKQPFIVRANGTEIQVLGTSFNVNAYSDENTIKTTLINGSIKVLSNPTNGIILKPGEQAIINRASQDPVNPKIRLIQVQTADIEQVLAWKNGSFNLQNLSLQEVARQLQRWYDIEVKYEGNVPDKKFKGELDRGVRLSTVLNWFSELGIHNKLEGDTLILSAD